MKLTDPVGSVRDAQQQPVQPPDYPFNWDGSKYLAPFENRVIQIQPDPDSHSRKKKPGDVPEDFEPWWRPKAISKLRESSQAIEVTVPGLVLNALKHSPYIRAISDIPLIRETGITEAESEFDPRAFMESKWIRTSDPVGSTLTTGGPPRLRDSNWSYIAGVRKRTATGAQFEASQRIGYEDSNSLFFVPTQQGNARLSISFTQPLLNRAGRAYNTSLILLAQIDADIAKEEFSEGLQDHLLQVTDAYWELYVQRATFLQKRRLYERAKKILLELDNRRDIDALQSQILRARATVATREADIRRAELAARNAESRIRALVGAPVFVTAAQQELLPTQIPARAYIDVSLRDSLITALKHRPEIDQAVGNIRMAATRLNMSKNELLPVLNLVMESYVSGIQGDSDVAGSLIDQFSEGEPSFTVGLLFELPLGNRGARARHDRLHLQLRQLTNQFNNTVETIMVEVEVAVREVETTYSEIQSKFRAMIANEDELLYLQERWQLLPGEDQPASSFVLEELLDAQERLADAEGGFVYAQAAYDLALARLNRAMGTLLEYEEVTSSHRNKSDTYRSSWSDING